VPSLPQRRQSRRFAEYQANSSYTLKYHDNWKKYSRRQTEGGVLLGKAVLWTTAVAHSTSRMG